MSRRTLKHDPMRRSSNTRDVRTVFIVSGEGQTERTYFQMRAFKSLSHVAIKQPPNTVASRTRTNPRSVIKRAQDLEKGLRRDGGPRTPDDQAWVVVDTDSWSDDDRKALSKYQDSNDRRHVAISNPKIELFLLMHFEDAGGCSTPEDVDRRLGRAWPNHQKVIPFQQFSKSQILDAVRRSKAKRPNGEDGYPPPGTTDLHRLVEGIFRVEDKLAGKPDSSHE